MKSKGWGSRIKAMREERGWTQEQLGLVADVSPRTIQRLEREKPARFDSLRALAAAFNVEVKDLLGTETQVGRPQEPPHVSFLLGLKRGSELFGLVGGAQIWSADQDELGNEEQIRLVASFFQDVHDYGEMWDEIEPGERVQVSQEFTSRISELEAAGLSVFGARQRKSYRFEFDGGKVIPMESCVLYVARASNPAIVKASSAGDFLPKVQ